jgi:hypothetical protein
MPHREQIPEDSVVLQSKACTAHGKEPAKEPIPQDSVAFGAHTCLAPAQPMMALQSQGADGERTGENTASQRADSGGCLSQSSGPGLHFLGDPCPAEPLQRPRNPKAPHGAESRFGVEAACRAAANWGGFGCLRGTGPEPPQDRCLWGFGMAEPGPYSEPHMAGSGACGAPDLPSPRPTESRCGRMVLPVGVMALQSPRRGAAEVLQRALRSHCTGPAEPGPHTEAIGCLAGRSAAGPPCRARAQQREPIRESEPFSVGACRVSVACEPRCCGGRADASESHCIVNGTDPASMALSGLRPLQSPGQALQSSCRGSAEPSLHTESRFSRTPLRCQWGSGLEMPCGAPGAPRDAIRECRRATSDPLQPPRHRGPIRMLRCCGAPAEPQQRPLHSAFRRVSWSVGTPGPGELLPLQPAHIQRVPIPETQLSVGMPCRKPADLTLP